MSFLHWLENLGASLHERTEAISAAQLGRNAHGIADVGMRDCWAQRACSMGVRKEIKRMEAFDGAKTRSNVVIETPKGGRVKHGYDEETGRLHRRSASAGEPGSRRAQLPGLVGKGYYDPGVERRTGSQELTNADIAELLALEAEKASYPLQRALRRAGRAAFLWTTEASEMERQRRPLTELKGVGPYLAKLIQQWLRERPRIPKREEIRRNFLTWPQAQRILAQDPGWKKRARGDLQMHTQWSDGSGTVRAMAQAGRARGYEYVAITDHGKKLKIAGGINEQELKAQGREIEEVNGEMQASNFRVLRSIELNLDAGGNGDMEPEALAELDLVLGAFHSSLRKSEDQTERYLAALRHPRLHILGHPRGRIYNYRLGLNADWKRVFGEAERLGKAVEIDCYPDRQDLSMDLIELAREAGVMISIGTDAHHPWQLEFLDLGLAAALAGGIAEDRILNFRTADELMEWSGGVRRTGSLRGSFRNPKRLKEQSKNETETHGKAKKRGQAAAG